WLVGADRLLEGDRDRVVGDRRDPGLEGAADRAERAARADLHRRDERERAVDQATGRVRAQVLDGQRGVQRRADDARGRLSRVLLAETRREGAERGRRAE